MQRFKHYIFEGFLLAAVIALALSDFRLFNRVGIITKDYVEFKSVGPRFSAIDAAKIEGRIEALEKYVKEKN